MNKVYYQYYSLLPYQTRPVIIPMAEHHAKEQCDRLRVMINRVRK